MIRTFPEFENEYLLNMYVCMFSGRAIRIKAKHGLCFYSDNAVCIHLYLGQMCCPVSINFSISTKRQDLCLSGLFLIV